MSFSTLQRYTILIVYFLIMCVLFCLPGSALPKQEWFNKIYLDKWIHIGLFALFTYLLCWAIVISNRKALLSAFIGAVLYGITIEFVQDQFIANRSFDLGDWGADIVGGFIGLWIWNLRYIKK